MRSSLATAALLIVGFGWVFLFPPANAELETEPRLVAQDTPPGTDAAVATVASTKKSPRGIRISLDSDSDDLEAEFLKKRIVVNFNALPISDALEFISEQAQVPVLLDTVSLEEAGLLAADEPITFSSILDGSKKGEFEANRMRIDQALDLMLRDLELTWYVEDGILQVMTIEAANEHVINRSYNLAPFRNAGIDPDTLVRIVIQESNGLWEEYDGVTDLVLIVGDVMTIRQTYQVHRELLAMLKAMLEPGKPVYGVYHAEYIASRQSLQKPVTVNFSDLSLIDAMKFISLEIGSRIFLDTITIQEAGLLIQEPITFHLQDRSAATTLRLMLRDFQLTTSIRSGEVFVTTVEVANENLHTVVYDIRELHDREHLKTALKTLSSGEWEETHGSGGSLSLTENGLLVIRQTDQIHQEIAESLKLHAASPTVVVDQSSINVLETRFYRVPAETAEDLLTALPALVASETWQVPDSPPGIAPDRNPLEVGTIRKVAVGQKIVELPGPKATPKGSKKAPANGEGKKTETKPAPPPEVILVAESVLIIEQTRAVHQKIDQFLRSLDLADSALGQKLGQGGMGGGGFF